MLEAEMCTDHIDTELCGLIDKLVEYVNSDEFVTDPEFRVFEIVKLLSLLLYVEVFQRNETAQSKPSKALGYLLTRLFEVAEQSPTIFSKLNTEAKSMIYRSLYIIKLFNLLDQAGVSQQT
jgi:hypothetical protein